MAVEKRRRANGTYRYRAYWRNPFTGKIERGAWTAEGKATKESDQVAYRLKHEKDSFLPANKPAIGAGPLLLDLLSSYHAMAEMTDSTYKSTFYHLKAVKAHALFNGLQVQDLTPGHLKAFERALRMAGRKQNGINRKIGIITAALTWAHEQRLIDSIPINPAEYKCKRGPDKRTPPPTPREVEELHAAASDHVRRAIFVAYMTGARVGPSELLSMRWSDFFFHEGFIRVRSADKNDDIQWRDVPVEDDAAWTMFREWCEVDTAKGIQFVIHWRGKPISHFRTAWKRTFERANAAREKRKEQPIAYRNPYSLRHAFVTFMLAGGADLKTTSKLAGHSDVSTTTRIYQHEVEELRKDAARKLPKLNLSQSDALGIQTGDTKSGVSGGFLYPKENKLQ